MLEAIITIVTVQTLPQLGVAIYTMCPKLLYIKSTRVYIQRHKHVVFCLIQHPLFRQKVK